MKTVQMNIDKFLGLHSDALGDTELNAGELSDMKNFTITKGYNAEKRGGYTALLTAATAHAIKGQWYGNIAGTFYHIFASNGHIYKFNTGGGTTDLGTLTDATTNFFYFGDAVYIQNGTEYKKWTGSGVISDVVGYVPLVMNSRNIGDTGTGTAQEGINNLTSQRRMKFNGVAGQTVATLPEVNITSVDKVYVNGALKTVTTDYTSDLVTGEITAATFATVGVDNIEIVWTNLSKTQLFDGTGSQIDFQLDDTNITSITSVTSVTTSVSAATLKNFTAINTTGYVCILCNSHGYSDNATIRFEGASLPSPLVENVTYYVYPLGANDFFVRTTLGGARISYIGVGSGSMFLAPAYIVDTATGLVSIHPAPVAGNKSVTIVYQSSATEYPTISTQTNSRLYGGKNDTRVFIFGVDNNIYYSGLADGVPSAEYFPALNFIKVGSNNSKVMDLSKQYDRLIIFKEDSTGWASYEYTDVLGVEFPIYPLNDVVGCQIKGSTQVILNNPVTIHDNKVYQFVASNVRDERNAVLMSTRVQPLLDAETLTNAITFDNEEGSEYWISFAKECYIYNYVLDAWYFYEFADTVTSITKTTKMILGTSAGQLMSLDESLTDNGTAITAYIKTGFMNYETIMYKKFVNFIWVQLFLDGTATKADVYYQTDKDLETLIKSLAFTTETNPKAKYMKPKMKGFVNAKFIIKNSSTTQKCRILGISAPAIIGGISK